MSIPLLKTKKKMFSILNISSIERKTISPLSVLKRRTRNQKLVLVLAISTLVIVIRKKVDKNIGAGEDGKNLKTTTGVDENG